MPNLHWEGTRCGDLLTYIEGSNVTVKYYRLGTDRRAAPNVFYHIKPIHRPFRDLYALVRGPSLRPSPFDLLVAFHADDAGARLAICRLKDQRSVEKPLYVLRVVYTWNARYRYADFYTPVSHNKLVR
jgi:hypothetical protein